MGLKFSRMNTYEKRLERAKKLTKYTLRSFVPMVLPFGKLKAGRTRIFLDARL